MKLLTDAATWPRRLILLRTTMGTNHRELAVDWAMRLGGPVTVVAPKQLVGSWEVLLPMAEVLSRETAAAHPERISRNTAIFDTPHSGNRFTERYRMLETVAAEARNVLIDVYPASITQREIMGVLSASCVLPVILYPELSG